MNRWILLAIGDQDVDVLSRLPRDAAPSDIVIYHPDPDALVLRLADVAELHLVDRLPDPNPQDVLVISEQVGTDHVEDAWRRVGARVMRPEEVGILDGAQEEQARMAAQATDDRIEDHSTHYEEPVTATQMMLQVANGPDISSTRESSRMQDQRHEMEEREVATMDSGPDRDEYRSAPAPRDMSVEIWTDPASTFRYLMDQFGVRDYILWWDGENDSWVPMVSSVPVHEAVPSGSRPDGFDVSHRWGRFVLSGADEDRVFRPALARVAEDMALRDLEDWRRSGERLRSRMPSEEPSDLPAWGRWFDDALPVLGADAALLWLRQDGAWRLARAWGEGVGLAGELRLPEPLFAATFGPGSMWRSWQPFSSYRVLFTPRDGDHTWPLRQARLHQLMAAARPR
jgi:hypothetical protein